MIYDTLIKPWSRQAPQGYVFKNANVVDVATGSILENSCVTVTDGKITSISSSAPQPSPTGSILVDCEGRYLSPGLFNAHVHFCAVPGFQELSAAFGNFNDVSLLRQPYVAAQMLHRGFTSVRDCGGAQLALKQAIEDGVFPGPRLFIAGHALSQFGGHGDIRGSNDRTQCCGGHTNGLGHLCNGVPECMAAVREEIRCRADFIKIIGSRGVSTPTDKLEHLQFTPSEIKAMVECADNAGTFVTAHAYTPKAIRHCIDNGVRGIEHGNFLDEATANIMAEKGVYLTPTLVTYSEIGSKRWKGYLLPDKQTKNTEVLNAGLRGLKVASEAGVTICFGTDLLGPLQIAQTTEFKLRSKVLSPLAVLQSATINPAKMLGQEDIGQIKAGFQDDLLLLAKNPLEDVTIFDEPEKYVLGVMKEGRAYITRWDGLKVDAEIPVRVKAAL
ncbi:Fc.00g105040.m01.CDS01 [Cosmosporella sp. VM-42]